MFETFIINISIFTLCCLVLAGISIWIIEDDIFIYLYPHSYNFIWFLVITNAFISFTTVVLSTSQKTKFIIQREVTKLGDLIYILIISYAFVASIFWLGISSNFAKITSECFSFKKRVAYASFFNKTTCTGEIMISIFGFAICIFYSIMLISNVVYVVKTIYKYNESVLNELQMEEQVEQEQVQQEQV